MLVLWLGGALHSTHRHPAGDGLVKDPTQQRRVVRHAEQVALGISDVIGPPPAHQRAQVSLVDLSAHSNDEELHVGISNLAHPLLQHRLGDALGPAVGEEHQFLPATRGVAASAQGPHGKIHGPQHVSAVILESRLFSALGQQGQVGVKPMLHAEVPAVLTQAHPHDGPELSLGGQEALDEAAHEGLAGLKVLLAHAGRAVHHHQDVGGFSKRNYKGKEHKRFRAAETGIFSVCVVKLNRFDL